jgi:formylglycine-generating enzyme required for sulfatase activity
VCLPFCRKSAHLKRKNTMNGTIRNQLKNGTARLLYALITPFLGSVCFDARAQAPAELAIQTYAGLTITGMEGKVYSIRYVTDLGQARDPGAWRCLEFLQLPANPFLWVDKSAPAKGVRFYRAVEFPAPTNMVFIPPGTSRLSCPTTETTVRIGQGFWMGKYEVTQGEYLEVMGVNPSWFNGFKLGGFAGENGTDYGTDLARPVESVDYRDAVAYCATLTERERAAGRIPAGSLYRLPTETEWEYACRAWNSSRFGSEDEATIQANCAWSGEEAMTGTTHPVGQKLPNPWGLYDMLGNVWEACDKVWAGWGYVYRGGDWSNIPNDCEPASRSVVNPGGWGACMGPPPPHPTSTGFRLVLSQGAL